MRSGDKHNFTRSWVCLLFLFSRSPDNGRRRHTARALNPYCDKARAPSCTRPAASYINLSRETLSQALSFKRRSYRASGMTGQSENKNKATTPVLVSTFIAGIMAHDAATEQTTQIRTTSHRLGRIVVIVEVRILYAFASTAISRCFLVRCKAAVRLPIHHTKEKFKAYICRTKRAHAGSRSTRRRPFCRIGQLVI